MSITRTKTTSLYNDLTKFTEDVQERMAEVVSTDKDELKILHDVYDKAKSLLNELEYLV